MVNSSGSHLAEVMMVEAAVLLALLLFVEAAVLTLQVLPADALSSPGVMAMVALEISAQRLYILLALLPDSFYKRCAPDSQHPQLQCFRRIVLTLAAVSLHKSSRKIPALPANQSLSCLGLLAVQDAVSPSIVAAILCVVTLGDGIAVLVEG